MGDPMIPNTAVIQQYQDASTRSYHISGLKEKLKSAKKLKKEIKQLERLLLE